MPGRIEDDALIGDFLSGALVSKDGSIDWLCLPRFDSAALFAALLGDETHGRWRIAPAGDSRRVRRRYLGKTMVLETTFETDAGSCRTLDAMLLGTPDPDLVRIVEGISGSIDLEMDLTIRFNYGSIVPWVRRSGRGGVAFAALPQGADLQAYRQHRRRPDHVAAGAGRRRPQLGLPLLLGAGRDVYALRARPHRVSAGGRGVGGLARAGRGRHSVAAEHHVRPCRRTAAHRARVAARL